MSNFAKSESGEMTDHFGKALHNTCKVLIALHENGPMTSNELIKLTGIQNAGTVCCALAVKQKVRRQNPLAKTGYIWEAIPDHEFEPNPRPKMVVNNTPRQRTLNQSVANRVQVDKKKNAVRTTFIGVAFRDKKIDFLRDLAANMDHPIKKDLVIGIIADYEGRQ